MVRVVVVGGGLAGMTAAARLLERGCEVTLFDEATSLGGKAGATRTADDWDEHGYHIFPAWYLNTWHLVDELGIRDTFIDCSDFEQLHIGSWPRTRTLRNLMSVESIWRNVWSGVMPIPEMILFFYSGIDLMSQTYSDRAFLDQNTIIGFVRSRFYRTEQVARQHQELMLKGISVPAYVVSAMTMKKVMQFWMRYPDPMYRILRGNLQELFIEPFVERLRTLGCEIKLEHELKQIEVSGSRISRLTFDASDDTVSVDTPNDEVILAVPAERLAALITDELYAAAPTLGDVKYLRARPMAALNLYFSERIPDMPADHTSLIDSKFGLSFIDVSQRWEDYSTTVLNIIASDSTPLEGLSDSSATQAIIDELARYIPPVKHAALRRCHYQSHVSEPLFSNEVGAWHYRLDALPDDERHAVELANCHPAGDHCRTAIDLTCMEGAVSSGLKAAEAARRNLGLNGPVQIHEPHTHPRALLSAARIRLIPVAAGAKLATLLTSR
jgi:uncharacterized protein with NAD-binding domain and iron-sulfur cluster